MNDKLDEGLRGELQKQGIWVTSMQDLYNWAVSYTHLTLPTTPYV